MKIGRLVTRTSLGFLIGMTLVSCKEEKTPPLTSTEQTQEIVRTKTNCRDMLMHTLDEGQWQILLEKLS